MGTFSKSCISLCALAASGMLAPESAHAADQEVASPDQELPAGDDIVVTAQKRSQSLRDVPLSVSALGEDAIRAVGHQDVTALVTRIPSLQVQQFSPATVVFNIRGVSQNNFADSQEAPIAFYNDEVYGAALSSISGQNFDLERIEVLRGPQGTLFGRNATGGLVQYITAKPTREFAGFATLTLGRFGEVGTEAALSGPLSDSVRARISVSSDKYGPYIKNLAGRDIGNRDFLAGRFQIESDVGDGGLLRIKVQAMRNRNEASAPYSWGASVPDADGLGVPNPGGSDAYGYRNPSDDPFVQSNNTVPLFRRRFWSATARYEQSLGSDITLTSITDYQKVTKHYGEDTDLGPTSQFIYLQDQNQWQASQELRLSGSNDRFQWVAGVYGLLIDANATQTVDAAAFGTVQTGGGVQKTASYALFGQADYKLSDQLTVTLGGRYSHDLKRNYYTHISDGVIDDQFNPSTDPRARQTFSNWSGKAGLEFRPANDVLLYASVNRGTKSGGFDIPIFLGARGNIPYDQEVLTSYEAGFKVSLLDRLIDLSGAVFHYDYKDYQAFIIQGVSSVIRNLPAKVDGFELELNVRPAQGIQFGGFLTHLNSKVSNVALPFGRLAERELPQAPHWTIGWNARIETEIGSGTLALSTDWRYDSTFFHSTFNEETGREPGHVVGNVQLRYDATHWGVGLFVNNVTDKRYRVYNIDNTLLQGTYNSTFALPRWAGGTVTLRY